MAWPNEPTRQIGAGAAPQPRQPAGAPAGGRWARSAKDRAGIALYPDGNGGTVIDMCDSVSDEKYNEAGTYSHPPIPRSIPQMVKFWLGVKIPDHVLDQIAAAYSNRNVSRREAAAAASTNSSKGVRRSTRDANSDQATRLAEIAGRQEWSTIPGYVLADVVRLGCIYRQSNCLPEDDCQELLDTEFVFNSRTAKMSPRQTWDRYELGEIEAAFNDTRERDQEAKREYEIWNLYQASNRIGNLVGPPGRERPPDYIPYGGFTT